MTHGEHRAERQLYGQEDGSARGASPEVWAWRLLSLVILGDAAAGRLTGQSRGSPLLTLEQRETRVPQEGLGSEGRDAAPAGLGRPR